MINTCESFKNLKKNHSCDSVVTAKKELMHLKEIICKNMFEYLKINSLFLYYS